MACFKPSFSNNCHLWPRSRLRGIEVAGGCYATQATGSRHGARIADLRTITVQSELLNRSPQRFHCLPAYPPTFTIFNSYEHGVMVQLDDGGVDVLCQSH